MLNPRRKDQPGLIAARAWAKSAPIEELRRGNADRVARSYGIPAADALSIIVNAYRQRSSK
jgi:hypothetical protein